MIITFTDFVSLFKIIIMLKKKDGLKLVLIFMKGKWSAKSNAI